MTRRIVFILIVILLVTLSACQSADESPPETSTPTLTPEPTQTHTPTPTPTDFPTLTPSLTATITLTPSKTIIPSQTNTLAPTLTLTPSATISATPTITPSPTASLTPVKLIVQSDVGAYVRSGPNTNYPVVGEVEAGETFDALAFTINTEGDTWYLITLENGTEAWLSQWVAERMDNVPLGLIAQAATVPASPTPLPTKTSTPTLTPSPTSTLPPGANARIYEASRVNLRSGPGLGFAKLGLLEPNAPLQLIGRSPTPHGSRSIPLTGVAVGC